MLMSRLIIFVSFFGLAISTCLAQDARPETSSDGIHLKLNTDEADAVLSILDKRASGAAIGDADWQRLFATEPYARLRQREAAMHREFTDEDFKKFVLSPELAAKAESLRRTLDAWRKIDLRTSARRVLEYLPDQATINAKVFPEIKPKTNSFVFDTNTDPAIFLYLDPEESAAKFENTVAHELHHIGFSSVDSLRKEKQRDLTANVRPAVEWMGAFGEGFAVLAAAGGPDADPHATSSEKERARWEHDLANFNHDLETLDQFFLDILNQNLSTKDAIDKKGFSFFGDAQGPWYTVGYKMAVIVEKRYGRKRLIECMIDPRELLSSYNRAADDMNRGGKGREQLSLWSPELIRQIRFRLAGSKRSASIP